MAFPRQPLITPTPHPPFLNSTAPDPADLRTSTLNKLSVTLVLSLEFSSCTCVTAVNCVRHLTAGDLKPWNSSILQHHLLLPFPSHCSTSTLTFLFPRWTRAMISSHSGRPLWWHLPLFCALSHPVPRARAALLYPELLPWAPSLPHCARDCQREILTYSIWPLSTVAIFTLQRNHLYLCPH